MRHALAPLRVSPFEVFREFDRFFQRSEEAWEGKGAYPVDIHETDQELVIEAELPGFSREQIEVSIEDGVLSIEARRQTPERKGEQHLQERRYTHVSRRFRLPQTVDTEKVGAQLADGVLTLTFPRREEVRPRRIEVK